MTRGSSATTHSFGGAHDTCTRDINEADSDGRRCRRYGLWMGSIGRSHNTVDYTVILFPGLHSRHLQAAVLLPGTRVRITWYIAHSTFVYKIPYLGTVIKQDSGNCTGTGTG